jgi:hypothetical protein
MRVMQPRKSKWKLVTRYGDPSYACGLQAGERVELKMPLVIYDPAGTPTGEVHPAGEVWTVLSGAKDDPGVIWFRDANGDRHTWDDEAVQIDEWFRRVGPAE